MASRIKLSEDRSFSRSARVFGLCRNFDDFGLYRFFELSRFFDHSTTTTTTIITLIVLNHTRWRCQVLLMIQS